MRGKRVIIEPASTGAIAIFPDVMMKEITLCLASLPPYQVPLSTGRDGATRGNTRLKMGLVQVMASCFFLR